MSVFNAYIQKNTYSKYYDKIHKKRKAIFLIYKENTIYFGSAIQKSIYTEILWAGGKLKKKKLFIYKRNTPMYIYGKYTYREYILIIYIRRKKHLYSIYSKTHIFLGKMSNFHIYIRKTYTTIWAEYKEKCIDKKVLFLLQGKHYIYRKYTFLGQNTKEKRGFLLYIRKHQ